MFGYKTYPLKEWMVGIVESTVVKDKNVLITGGTGSVGRLLVRAALAGGARSVRIFDMDETREFHMARHLKKKYESGVRFLLGDVRDRERVQRAMENVDIVFHCAALKHVLSSEYNPFEAVKTNAVGTQNVVDAALDADVEKVILTSSDKAVNPCNVMGATKLLSERLVTAANYYKGSRKTILSSVRFGNVLGSRGSVVPLFQKQIGKGGPLTITHEGMTRFVMTPRQTTRLIFRATELAQGGEIFVLKMPVLRIPDLVHAMIGYYGPALGQNPQKIKTKTIGTLPGEKLYEELMTAEESGHALETDELFIILPEAQDGLMQPHDRSRYGGARPARVAAFDSRAGPFLDTAGIRRLLGEIKA